MHERCEPLGRVELPFFAFFSSLHVRRFHDAEVLLLVLIQQKLWLLHVRPPGARQNYDRCGPDTAHAILDLVQTILGQEVRDVLPDVRLNTTQVGFFFWTWEC